MQETSEEDIDTEASKSKRGQCGLDKQAWHSYHSVCDFDDLEGEGSETFFLILFESPSQTRR